MANNNDPTEQFLLGFGGGFHTNLNDWKQILSLRRPTIEEAQDQAKLINPITKDAYGSMGYDLGSYFPLPPIRHYIPTFFREGQLSPEEQAQAEASRRAMFLRRYKPEQMSPPDVETIRQQLLTDNYGQYVPGKGLLGL